MWRTILDTLLALLFVMVVSFALLRYSPVRFYFYLRKRLSRCLSALVRRLNPFYRPVIRP